METENKKSQKSIEDFLVIDGFQVENQDKLERVILGTVSRAGEMVGGLGLDAEPSVVLAHYDKLGGFITKDGVKVKNGSFWDVKLKAPREKPEVLFIYNIGGDNVEVEDPSKLHQAIEVVGKAKEAKAKKFKEAKAKSKFNKDK